MLEVVLPHQQLHTSAAAAACLSKVTEPNEDAHVVVYGRSMRAAAFLVEARTADHFEVEVSGHIFVFGGVRSHDLTLLTAEGLPSEAESDLVLDLAARCPLISARTFDKDYEHWQNADDPLEFEVAGRSTSNLPMKSNQLPPPLEDMIVDTSENPGRRVLRVGYVEAVGHLMWLGPGYFDRVNRVTRTELLGADWLTVNELAHGVLELVASDSAFTERSDVELQLRLRQLLFPTSDQNGG